VKRTHLVPVLAASVLLGCGHDVPAPVPATATAVAPEQRLLRDVRAIADDHDNGQWTHFALVPRAEPPGLLGMEGIGDINDTGATDVYRAGSPAVRATVWFTAKRPPGCEPPACVRSGRVEPAGEAPDHGYVTIQLSAGPATDQERAFWEKAEFVPAREAPWFARLLTRAGSLGP
jgi:hypothetical protein